jgi:tetratricopeptide (TPR) repeat protein
MQGFWLETRAWLAALVVVLGATRGWAAQPEARGDDLRRQVLALNRLTGDDPVNDRFRELVADPPGARKLLDAARALLKQKSPPFSSNAAMILARLAEELKDLPTSEAFYRVCIHRAAQLQSPIKLTEAYFNLIDQLYDRGKYKRCAAICKEFLEFKGDESSGAKVYLIAAEADEDGNTTFVDAERWDESLDRVKPIVHRRLIQAIAKQGKMDEATRLVNTLVKARPDNWQDLHLKGWVLREAKKNKEAAQVFENVIERVTRDKTLDEEERGKYLEQYRYSLSNLYMELKQVTRATGQLQALLKLRPDSPTYNNDLGYIWADHDVHLAEAEKLIRKALEEDRKLRKKYKDRLKPGEDRDNAAFLDSLGWVLYKRGKYQEAKEALLKAVADKDSQSIEVYDHLAEVFLALKDKAKAVEAWKKGLKVAGSSKREQEVKAAVEKKIKAHQ